MHRFSTRKLSTQIFIAQLAILTATVLIGFALFARVERSQLYRQYEARAASIAQTVAGVPAIQSCLAGPGSPCPESVQTIASRIQAETHASYVVVIDMNRVRHSHPIPTLIGQKVAEPIVTADGHTHVGIDDGKTGLSANGKAPLYTADHRMVGEVSVGITESSVSHALWRELPSYAEWFAVALAAGALASWFLARTLKRKTFGLELDEIAHLLQEREATLHGIREGVIAFDPSGRVSVVNDEARRLLGDIDVSLGAQLSDLLPPGRLRDVLAGTVSGPDEVVLTDDYCLTVNRRPVVLGGRDHGAVVTLRDRTEMSGLLRELDGVRRLTDALRAQQHEFSNRLHAVTGLLELGQVDDALLYLAELHGGAAEFADSLRARIGSPLIIGLLLGKAAEASERGLAFEITDDTWLGESTQKLQALTTILGNLVDNAFEALAGVAGGRVVVTIIDDDGAITIRVTDNGPGIPPGDRELIYRDGYTTKTGAGPLRRGLGLAIVHRLVQRLHGTIAVSEGAAPTFEVHLPVTTPAVPAGR
ncbi:MAG TPA: sensor histidine kinase [Jatrophihabitans sp.]|uniref:sensor histidine kinase n=1 Tax=Jatrophihabitans sp. TaxID=1932789 RepID=UPI002DF7E106|nr:sensor histidine kinase [Jatrophihabitans sp.]